jgi:hypothetical protein
VKSRSCSLFKKGDISCKSRRGNGEGSIYRRNDGRWVGEMTVEDRQRKFIYGKTRKEVQDKLQAAIHEKQQGVVLTGTARQTVGQFLVDWLENSQEQSVRPRTYERYEEVVQLHNPTNHVLNPLKALLKFLVHKNISSRLSPCLRC